MKRLYSLILVGLLGITAVRAQVGGLVNQVENAQDRRQLMQSEAFKEGDSAPQLYEGEESDLGPQSVLQRKSRRTLFEATGDVQLFRTDNMFLTDEGTLADMDALVLVSAVELALAPTPYPLAGGQLAPRLGYRHQWFDFGLDNKRLPFSTLRLSDFNFNSQTVFADLRWSRDNWVVDGGVDAMRLMTTGGYDEFYKELVPYWGVTRILPLNDKASFAVGYEGNYHFTDSKVDLFPFNDSDVSDRTDQALFVTYTHVLCRHAVVQPYYRFKYTHFTHAALGTRNDYLNSIGASLYLLVCRNFDVRVFVAYDIKETDSDIVPEYHKLDAGGGVNLTFRF